MSKEDSCGPSCVFDIQGTELDVWVLDDVVVFDWPEDTLPCFSPEQAKEVAKALYTCAQWIESPGTKLPLQRLSKVHRDATARALTRLSSLDAEQALATLQQAGIVGRTGALTTRYGGTDEECEAYTKDKR